MSDQQDDILGNFIPFNPKQEHPLQKRPYTPEEDERIWETINFAIEQGLPKSVAFNRLADELDNRNAKSIEAHFYALKKKKNGNEIDEDEDEDDDDSLGFLKKLKSVVKDQNNYKAKYEALKADHDKLTQEHDKLLRELNKIRRLFED